MKKWCCLLLLLNVCTYAQRFTINKRDAWTPAIIERKDHSITTSEIQNFNYPETYEIYEKDTDGKPVRIGIEEIESITMVDDDQRSILFEKLKVKRITKRNEAVDSGYEVFMPLYRKGKVNLYGKTTLWCHNPDGLGIKTKCRPGFPLTYIKKANDEFAYVPIQQSLSVALDVARPSDQMIGCFRQIAQQCPKFLSYLDELKQEDKSEAFRDEVKLKWKVIEAEKSKLLKTAKNSSERKQIKAFFVLKRFAAVEVNMIEKYEAMCD